MRHPLRPGPALARRAGLGVVSGVLALCGVLAAEAAEIRVGGQAAVPADVVLPHPEDVPSGGLVVAGQRGVDRWARPRVVLAAPAGGPLAERWVAEGQGLVSPDADAGVAGRLLALEAEARAARRGIWQEAGWRVQPAAQVRGAVGDLVLVSGRVVAVGWGGDRLYLNFGEDRRRDFTARIARADARALTRGGIDPERLAGREVRLRGWLFYLGGPMIEIAGPAQIEVLP